ncbi:hypothetical protein AC578_2225 [Pseudocercospora eumusae]|uniref:Sugar phosphate transporter domain-containing protein n=1 Tax=Pseudocercospora eumusae TaxID=321146 RepID=A0A139HAX8_9PEZI|nr:hypothetical protein AC578_2225 [Pseudocercospora eumusae]
MDEKARDSNDNYEEAQAFLKQDEKDNFPPPPVLVPQRLSRRFWLSATVNTTGTAAIVFVNKRIFSDASLKHAQVTFAAFHFAVTFGLLYALSRTSIPMFQAKRIDSYLVVPLALAMIFNVVLPNASLANSSIQFYQVARVLLTPCVATLNYVLYKATIPKYAALMLVPVCIGVAVVSYFDTQPIGEAKMKGTNTWGVIFAFAGVFASSIYTVWIAKYHKTLECTSVQLLMNQAPMSVLILLYVIPFSDDVTVWRSTESHSWVLILLSGLLACLINLSQFVIINEAGPVSSTVVGHFKTCAIVAMGWIISRKPLKDGSLVGVVLAVGGIIAYSVVMQRQARK